MKSLTYLVVLVCKVKYTETRCSEQTQCVPSQLPTQPLPAVPQVTATLPAATATPPKGRKKAAAKNSEPPAVAPTATVVAAVPQLPTQPLPAAAAIQQTLPAPATPKGRKKATPKKPAAPTAPVVPASSLDSLIQAPDVVSLIQSLQQPVAPAAPQQPVPPAEITPKSRKKPTKKASQPSSTPKYGHCHTNTIYLLYNF